MRSHPSDGSTMDDDHLDKETSVSAEITPTSLRATAKSRAVAAIDRLIGNVFDRLNAPLEARIAEIRAQSAARIKIIDTLTALGIERLQSNPEIAARAVQAHIDTIIRRYQNKLSVVAAAIEDLERQPPNPDEAESGPETLSEEFLSRFQRYAEDATQETLRQKWGRILAAEIRKPGTFSLKTMRIVDELDRTSALLFERLCEHRIGNCIPKCLSGELTYDHATQLTISGLLVEPSLGQIRRFEKVTHGEKDLWIAKLGNARVAFLRTTQIPKDDNPELAPVTKIYPKVFDESYMMGVPIYLLTDAGHAISSILEDKQEENITEYLDRLASLLAPHEVYEYRTVSDQELSLVRTIKKALASDAAT